MKTLNLTTYADLEYILINNPECVTTATSFSGTLVYPNLNDNNETDLKEDLSKAQFFAYIGILITHNKFKGKITIDSSTMDRGVFTEVKAIFTNKVQD